MIEKEYKVLLSYEQYYEIKKKYKWNQSFEQTNYYYNDKDNFIDNNNITVRIREKDDKLYLQVKVPKSINKALAIKEEKELEIDKVYDEIPDDIINQLIPDVHEVLLTGEMKTYRYTNTEIPGIEICLDKNVYLEITDYELEIEYTDEEKVKQFLNQLKNDLDLSFNNTSIGKRNRFLKRQNQIGEHKNKKELPIAEPVVSAYLEDLFPITVALSDPRSYEWFYNNYIHLLYNDPERFSNQPLKFYKVSNRSGYTWDAECPALNNDKISVDILKENNIDIINFICNALSQDKYVLIFLDEYYLSYRPQFKRRHYIHDNFFYGFDKQKKELLGYSYNVEDNNYNLGKFTVSFSEVREAYEKAEYDGAQHRRINLLSPNKEKFFEFDINLLKLDLQDYLNSTQIDKRYSSINNPNNKYVFGINIYEKIKEYYYNREFEFQIITMQLLYEHKSVMKKRLLFLVENQYISYCPELLELCQNIEKKAYLCKMKCLKFSNSFTEDKYISFCKTLDEIKQQEIELYQKIINLIDKQEENTELLFSHSGFWYDVDYDIEGSLNFKFKLHIYSNNTDGYIVLTNKKIIREQIPIVMLAFDGKKKDFEMIFDDIHYEIEGLDCDIGEYIISISVTNEYVYVEIKKDGKKTSFKKGNMENLKNVDILNKLALIHKNSYRFAIEMIK